MILAMAVALVRLWTRVFTLGMPDTVRAWRRAEIESDLWEHAHDKTASAWQLIGRLVRGIPADVIWRIEEAAMRSKALVVIAGSVAAILVAGTIWLIDLMRADVLPTPPPIMVVVAPPPPPPPPPPSDQSTSLR